MHLFHILPIFLKTAIQTNIKFLKNKSSVRKPFHVLMAANSFLFSWTSQKNP